MLNRARGNEFSSTTVCIDSYSGGVMCGRFYSPYLEGGRTFHSLTQFLLEMEKVMNESEFPQAFTETRTFTGPQPTRPTSVETDFKPGRLATFAVKILFRQNASWQGSVRWINTRQGQSFRSVLELILLMDNALVSRSAQKEHIHKREAAQA